MATVAQSIEIVEEVRTLLEERARIFEQEMATRFIPRGREDSDELRLFPTVDDVVLLPEHLSSYSNESVIIVSAAWNINHTADRWLDPFFRGASLMGTFIDSKYSEQLGELLSVMGNALSEKGIYPAISEKYLEKCSRVTKTVLKNNEPLTTEYLLSYNLGVWWAMGHLKGIDSLDVRERIPSKLEKLLRWKRVKAPEWVENVLIARAQNALIEGI